MKRLFVVLFCSLCAQPALADLYLGAKAGYLSPTASRADSTSAGSVTLGYELVGVATADLSVEAEYTRTLNDGEFDLPGVGDVDYDYSNFGVFGVLRTPGPVYVRGRVGVVTQHIDVGGDDSDNTGAAAGLGVGFSLLGLEASLDWTRYLESEDLDDVDYLSLGLRF